MKYLVLVFVAVYSLSSFAAGKCKLDNLDGTWEYLGAPQGLSRLPGGVTISTAQGFIEVMDGEIVGGTLSQFFLQNDGSVNVLPAAVSSGTLSLDPISCRVKAEIDSGVTIRGITVPASYAGRGEYSRVARAIVGRARSLTTGGISTFMLRRP